MISNNYRVTQGEKIRLNMKIVHRMNKKVRVLIRKGSNV